MKKIFELIKNTWRSFGLSLTAAPKLTIWVAILTTMTYFIPLIQSKILGNIVDTLIKLGATGGLYAGAGLIVLYAAITMATSIINSLISFFNNIWRTYFSQFLEFITFKKRSEIDLGRYEEPKFQSLLDRAFNRGVWPIFENVEINFSLLGTICVIIVGSIIAVNLSWVVYLIILLSSIPLFIANYQYGKDIWGIWAENSERSKQLGHLKMHLRSRVGISQSKTLQATSKLLSMMDSIMTAFSNDQLRAGRRRVIWSICGAILSALGFGTALLMVYLSVRKGEIAIGELVFFVSIVGQLVGSINEFLRYLATMFASNFYVSDIFQVLDTHPYVKKPDHPVAFELTSPPSLELRNVSFRYEGREDWQLRNISMVIMPGEKIALVGENGAGKSTIIKLLCRIYDPTEGEILVNGINLKNIDPEVWRSYVALLLQDFLDYEFLLTDSIAMGRSDKPVDRQRVKEVTLLTGSHEFISEWKSGYDQQIGKEFENGIELSKGQRQRLALSRVLYRQGLVTILDEPTAAVSATGEMYIFEQMERAVGTNTLILITHRFNTTQTVDRIVVLDKGQVVEQGTHRELMELEGIYADMFRTQAKVFQEGDKKDMSSKEGEEQ